MGIEPDHGAVPALSLPMRGMVAAAPVSSEIFTFAAQFIAPLVRLAKLLIGTGPTRRRKGSDR
jgi:hypothetical protein